MKILVLKPFIFLLPYAEISHGFGFWDNMQNIGKEFGIETTVEEKRRKQDEAETELES